MRTLWIPLIAGVCLMAGAARGDNRPPLADAPEGAGDIVDGTLEVEVVNGCYMVMTGTVTTNAVGGFVHAYINTWDDGTFQQTITLTFPGDGGTHPYVASLQQLVPVLQGAAGLGVYLEDGPGLAAIVTFDSDGSVDVENICTGPAPDISGFDATAIPTLGRFGLGFLVALVALAAVALIVRRRSSPIE
jgi:hypothetical protein